MGKGSGKKQSKTGPGQAEIESYSTCPKVKLALYQFLH